MTKWLVDPKAPRSDRGTHAAGVGKFSNVRNSSVRRAGTSPAAPERPRAPWKKATSESNASRGDRASADTSGAVKGEAISTVRSSRSGVVAERSTSMLPAARRSQPLAQPASRIRAARAAASHQHGNPRRPRVERREHTPFEPGLRDGHRPSILTWGVIAADAALGCRRNGFGYPASACRMTPDAGIAASARARAARRPRAFRRRRRPCRRAASSRCRRRRRGGRSPSRARRRVEQRVEDRPVGDRVGAVFHAFGLAVRRRHRAGVEVVAADDDRRLQLAACAPAR